MSTPLRKILLPHIDWEEGKVTFWIVTITEDEYQKLCKRPREEAFNLPINKRVKKMFRKMIVQLMDTLGLTIEDLTHMFGRK